MDIITSHNALDFDGLASMVAAGILYPSAVKVFSGTLSEHVKKFMALYKDLIDIKTPKKIEMDQIERMIIVDTANINRLGHLKSTAERSNMKFYIYDHHPIAADDLKGEIVERHNTGAATTILVEEIRRLGIAVTPFDATILALGIYEDTGSLLFTSTTPRDVEAAAFLLARGANLSVVANFMEQSFSSEQRELLQGLLKNSRHYNIKNVDVIIAYTKAGEFIHGLDALTSRLLEVENGEAAFAIAVMKNKTYVVGRSRSNNVSINETLQALNGRGHSKAASAVVNHDKVEEIIEKILAELGKKTTPGLLARDIMSSPVRTIPSNVSMSDAGRIMLRYGYTGMPVVDGEKMIGVISRRDISKAQIHELDHAPVKGFMITGVWTATADTPVNDIQKLMIEYDIGRLPIVEDGKLRGIVSRTDILRTLHGTDYPEDHTVLFSDAGTTTQNYLSLMQERLPSRILSVLRLAGLMAEDLDARVYCVGGFVRDLFLRLPNFDVDLVVEGNGVALAENLAQRLGGRARTHARFKTAIVTWPDGFKVDIATARTEYYEFPAALPCVEKASIKEDLYRRDFTVNTLALELNPDRFGELIDFFGGRKDLENGKIRILYNFSFVEDPTRILRAIRFEQRYKFSIEEDTLRFARDAIERRLLNKLSPHRIMHELMLILEENDPVPSLERMKEIGVWDYIFPEMGLAAGDWNELRRIPVLYAWWNERYQFSNIEPWLIYVMLLVSKNSLKKALPAVHKYFPARRIMKAIEESFAAPALAEYFYSCDEAKLAPSLLDEKIGNWSNEAILYLLLCVKDEATWEKIVGYLDIKNEAKLEATGRDLKQMGIKPGPIYSFLLKELFKMKLDGKVKNKNDELEMLEKMIEEGNFINEFRN